MVIKHGQEERRVWRKLHLAVDSGTHTVFYRDAEAFPGLIWPTEYAD